MAMKPKRITQYTKNVARSFGYALGDVFSEYNPVIKSIGSEAKDNARDIYQNIKSVTMTKGDIDEAGFKKQAKSTINDVWNNFRDDLKSGNWYNKERSDGASDALAKSLGLDFDFDFDFDDDWGDFDDDEDSSSAKAVIESGDKNTKQMVTAMDQVGFKVSAAVSSATAESADYIVSSANRASRALYGLNERGFTSVNKSISALNDTVASLGQMAAPLSAHMQNAALFYTNTTKTLNDMNQSIQQIVKNTTPPELSSKGNANSVKGTFADIFDAEGIFSIDSYKDMIKENLSGYKDLTDMALNALKGMKAENGSYGKYISPMKFMTTMMTKALIPKMFKDSMTAFNDSLKYAISGAMVKGRESNSLFGLLADIFAPKDGFKREVNVSNYNKGAIAWDGKSRKALVEVIPTYLAKISAALGNEEKYYNYETGRFMTRESIEKTKRQDESTYARRAGGEFRTDALEAIKGKDNEEQLRAEIEAYFYNSFIKGGSGHKNIGKTNFKKEDYGLSDDSLAILNELVTSYRNSQDPKKRNIHNKFDFEVQGTRNEYGNRMRALEASGDSIFNYLNNGMNDKDVKNAPGVKTFNGSVLYYLEGIYNAVTKNGKRGKRNKGNNVSASERTRADANTSNNTRVEDVIEQILDEDQQREKDREEGKEQFKGAAKTKFGKILQTIKGFFNKDNPVGLQSLWNKPFEAFAGVLNKLSLNLDKLFWGEGDDEEGGLFGVIKKRTKETFDKFKKWLDDKFKINDKWDKVKNWFLGKENEAGVREGGVFDETRNWLNDKKSALGRTAKQFFGGPNFEGQAAYGRKVTKSGIVTVSEGEMIIPSELNPYYHGSTNKSSQIRKEDMLTKQWFGSYARGGFIDEFKRGYSSREQDPDKVARGKANRDSMYARKGEGKGHQYFRHGFNEIGSGFAKVAGVFSPGDEKKDRKIISGILDKLGNEITGDSEQAKSNRGAIGGGALLGAGASLLTGAVVGPLFGAAIGSAVALTANSKTVQRLLFGDVIDPKTGEVSGGLFNKEVSNFIKKHVPSMGKGAGIGAAAGLFMGSPILGAFVGSAVGYIKSSESAMKYLFGAKNEDGNWDEGLISKELQDKIKSAAPRMGVGAIAGLVAGPFGIAGNLIVGAGLGYLSTSDKFQEYLFGKGKDSEDKGLVGLIKTKIIDNLDGIFHNITNSFTGWFKNLTKSTTKHIANLISSAAKKFANGEDQGLLGKLVGGTVHLGGKAVKGTVGAVGGVLGGINRRLVRKNLEKGYAVYADAQDWDDEAGVYRKTKRNLTAAERVALRQSDKTKAKDKGFAARFDKSIAKINSREEMNNVIKLLSDANSRNEETASAARSALADMGINIEHDKQANLALDAAKAELKDKRFSDKNQEKLEEKNWRERLISILESLDRNVANESGGEPSELNESAKAKNAINNSERPKNPKEGDEWKSPDGKYYKFTNGKWEETTKDDLEADHGYGVPDLDAPTEETASEKIKRFTGSAKEKVSNKVNYVTDMLGFTHKQRENNQGEPIEDLQDNETKKARSQMNTVLDGFKSMSVFGGSMAGIGGILGSIKDKLFNPDKEKQSLFSKLFDKLVGEDGILSGLFSFFTGKEGLGGLLKGISLKSVFANLIAPALLVGGFAGKFDGILHKLTGGAYGNKEDTINVQDSQGNTHEATIDEEGNYVDTTTGEIITDASKVTGVNKNDVASFSDRLKYNTVRGLATGTGSVASFVLGRTAPGKAVKKAFANTMKAGSDDLCTALFTNIDDILKSISKKLASIPALKNVDIEGMFGTLSGKIATKLGSESAEAIAKAASNAVVIARIAFAVADFTTGYEDARTTLGIVTEPTIGQKIMSGLLRVVKNCIPIVGSLIPDSLVIDVFCDFIAPALGIDVEELKNAREYSQQQVDAYNAANGTDLTVEQFIKSEMKDYTWTERTGNAIKGTWEDTKLKAKNFKNSVKENGLLGTAKNMMADSINTFKDAYSENGGGIGGLFAGIGANFGNLLPGVLGEIVQKNMQIKSLAWQGKLKDMWSIALDDFSGGGKKIEGTDIETAVPSIFSKIIGQLPLLLNKLVMTPLALSAMVGNKIKEFLAPVFDKIKGVFTNIVQDNVSIYKSALKGDIKGLWTNDLTENDDPDNPLNGIFNVMNKIKQVTLTPIALVSWVGNKITEAIMKPIKKVGEFIGKFTSLQKTLNEHIFAGDLKGLWRADVEEDPENPIGGLGKIAFFGMKLMNTPTTIVSWMGHKLFDGVKTVAGKIKNSVTTLFNSEMNILSYVKAGDISGLWSSEIEDDEENPVGGITKAAYFAMKLMNTPTTIVSWMGHKLFDGVKTGIDKIKNSFTTLATNESTLMSYVKDGDVSGLWSVEMEDDEENPVGGITKAAFFAMKLFQTPGAFISSVGHKIFDGVSDMVTNTKDNYETMSTAVEALKSFAEDGDISGIWSQHLELKEGDPLSGIWNVGFTISKLFQSVIAIFNKIIGPVKDLVDGAGDFLDGVGDKVGDVIEGVENFGGNVVNKAKDVGSGVVEGVKNFGSGVADVASSAWDSATSWFGGGSGFVSQYNPKYGNYNIANSSFAEKGCGPAVASMAAAGMGKNLSVKQAVSASRGYQNSNGVSLDYFANALGSRGINTEIISGGGYGDMYNRIANGQQMILLGRDPYNTSKSNSPFGPYNHYVLATGLDGYGNIMVNDPELNGPTTYDPRILQSAMYGVASTSPKNGYFASAGRKVKKLGASNASRFGRIIRERSNRFKNSDLGQMFYGGGATGVRNDETTQQVWAYLTTQLGMSEAAAAGVMGNMQQESGCQPNRSQTGGGTAYGICQWDGGRKTNLMQRANYQNLSVQLDYLAEELPSQYWSKSGTITDVDGTTYSYSSMTYDQFKQSSDVATATIKFEAAFERAGKPHLAKRIEYAKGYYEMFTGKTYQYDPSLVTASAADAVMGASQSTSSATSGNNGKATMGSILSTISSAFSKGFAKVFGGDDGSDESSSSNGSSGSSDGGSYSQDGSYVSGNYVPVDAIGGPGTTEQKKLAAKMLSVKGMLNYSMSGARNPDSGTADCSSTVNWAYKNITGTDVGNNTLEILKNQNTDIIDMAGNMSETNGGTNSTGPDTSKLAPGDILLYSRPGKDYTVGRPFRVGHVEMYMGENKRIGHGGPEKGPKESDISKDANRYIMAKRLKTFINDGNASKNLLNNHTGYMPADVKEKLLAQANNASAAGSGLMIDSYQDIVNRSGGSSGILLNSRAGSRFNGSYKGSLSIPKYKISRMAGGDSGMDQAQQSTNMLNDIKNDVINKGKNGTIPSELVEKLLNSIIKILETIANNTNSVGQIYQVLTQYTQTAATSTTNSTSSYQDSSSYASGMGSGLVDPTIAGLVGTLAAIAKG